MGNHPFETKCKSIGEKTFDIESLVNNPQEFNEFLKLMFDYLSSILTSKQSGIFKRPKQPDILMIMSVLQKIVPLIKPSSLSIESYDLLNSIFPYFLHPDSSEYIRSQAIDFLLQIIISVPIKYFDHFEKSVELLVPFYCFCRSSDEKEQFSFQLNLQDIPSLRYGSHPPPTPKEGINDIRHIIEFCYEHWTSNTKSLDMNHLFFKLLFENIFFIIYKDAVILSKYNIPPFFFLPPLHESLHAEVMNFLAQAFQNDNIMEGIFLTPNSVFLVIYILKSNCLKNNLEFQLSSLHYFSQMLSKPYAKRINQMDQTIIKTIGEVAGDIIASFQINLRIADPSFPQIIDNIYSFVYTYILFFRNNISNEIGLPILSEVLSSLLETKPKQYVFGF